MARHAQPDRRPTAHRDARIIDHTPTYEAGSDVPNAAHPVIVLLSTYDGARFLDAQLASFAAQTHRDWSLVWRDDGSGDDSRRRVETFISTARIRANDLTDGRHLGITGSFWALLRAVAARAVSDGAIVAFADQDDVWLPEKLARAVAALDGVDPGLPALYCARQRLVDARLRDLGLSPDYGDLPGFPDALTQNVATGCTVALNPAATALLARSRPPSGTLHDWWAYLIVTGAGGRMIVDPEPVVLYRQHAGNAVGAPSSWLTRAIAALHRGPGVFMTTFRGHVDALSEQRALLDVESGRIVERLARSLRRGRLVRILTLMRGPRLRRRTRSETLLFRLWFVLG